MIAARREHFGATSSPHLFLGRVMVCGGEWGMAAASIGTCPLRSEVAALAVVACVSGGGGVIGGG